MPRGTRSILVQAGTAVQGASARRQALQWQTRAGCAAACLPAAALAGQGPQSMPCPSTAGALQCRIKQAMPPTHPQLDARLHWTLEVSLLGNPVVLRQTAAVFLVAWVVLSLLLSALFALEGDFKGIGPTLAVLAAVHLALFLASLAVMVLYFGNRITMAFTLDERGVWSEVRSSRARKAARWAALLGLATGNVSAAGAGMLAHSGARSFVPWKAAGQLRCDDARHSFCLVSGWRTLATVFCTAQVYPDARAWALRLCKA